MSIRVALKKPLKAFGKKSKGSFYNLMKAPASAHWVAMGFTVGTFFCVLPTPGLSIVLASFVAYYFKRINRIALVSSFVIWNPFVTVPINAFVGGTLGRMFVSNLGRTEENQAPFMRKIYHITEGVVLGNLIVSFIISMVSYVVIWIVVDRYQKRKKRLLARKP